MRRHSRIDRNRFSGVNAIYGAVVALVGVLAAANPRSALLRAMNEAAPRLAAALPAVITMCGAIIAAFSPPPRFHVAARRSRAESQRETSIEPHRRRHRRDAKGRTSPGALPSDDKSHR